MLEKFSCKENRGRKLVRKRYLTVVLCTLVLVLTSCQREGEVEKAGKKVDQAAAQVEKKVEKTGEAVGSRVEIATASLDDAAITAKIKTEIIKDSLLKMAEIEVSTTGGVVKLKGTVKSQTSIDRAVEIARSIKDVKSVESTLVVREN